MKCWIPVAATCLILVGGCLLGDPSSRYQPLVEAQISASRTSGEAPLRVVVSAAQSASPSGAIVKYIWDFAGQARVEGMTAEHTFLSPGRFPITLTVTDAAGEQASARVVVRVAGGSVTAVINADRLSGPAPLAVQFDGSASSAVDDTIRDYFWEFGDGDESRLMAPLHIYDRAGSFTARLRVVSAGGVEGASEALIEVGQAAGGASLQFNGSQYATLPVDPNEPLAAFTFEAWCKPVAAGGTLVNFGVPNVGIDISPDDGAITLRAGTGSAAVAAALLPEQWQHVAVSYAGDTGATVYLDGAALGTVELTGQFAATVLTLGPGYQGKLARVRFWSVARTGAEIVADMNGSVTGFEVGLLGDWPLSSGSGQGLANNAAGTESGALGAGDAVEPADPAWSSESP